jgi:hypothetical protein
LFKVARFDRLANTVRLGHKGALLLELLLFFEDARISFSPLFVKLLVALLDHLHLLGVSEGVTPRLVEVKACS